VSIRKIPPKNALSLCKQKILRFWGLAAQRGWARQASPSDCHKTAKKMPDEVFK
jgi:hypothetical protein